VQNAYVKKREKILDLAAHSRETKPLTASDVYSIFCQLVPEVPSNFTADKARAPALKMIYGMTTN
jgi:hypothetical protein